ncbi:MAG TPA: ABC transporter permease [Longimicrobiales bacterium]|nr:ABC transporter permease [Longimicrobiales bacterium]
MTDVLQDIRYGFRMLVKTPVVSIVAALSLALGIAGATAMMAFVSAFLLEPLPFGDQDGLLLLQQLRRGDSIELASGVSMPNFRDLEEASTSFDGMTAYTVNAVNVTGVELPEQIQVISATPNVFEVLRIQPLMGRGFRADEGVAGTGGVIVVTHSYWQSHFLGDTGVLGGTIMLDGRQYSVIGVMPEAFQMLPADVEGFIPSDFADATDRASTAFIVFGRLRPGVALTQADAELTGAFARIETAYPDAIRNWTLDVSEARSFFPGPTDTKLVLLLLTVALFGLAIAGANVANLQLGRAELRMKEIAVRTTLGAGRLRILRQLLTESIVLSLVAGAVGTVLSLYVIRGLATAMPPELPRAFVPALDGPTLIATVVLAMLVGILFGLAPALHASGANLRDSLGEGTRGGTATRKRKRIRSAFVMGEVAVALALLTGAGYLMQAMDTVVNRDPGFDPAGLLTFELTLPEYRYGEPPEMAAFEREAERVLAGVNGVEGVAIMSTLPRSQSTPNTTFHVEGTQPAEDNDRPRTGWQAVNAAWFETLGVPLVSGRYIEASDRADTRPVAVVNHEFADRWFGEDDAVGRRIEVFGESREIVGVVGNIMQSRIALSGRGEAAVYLPIEQRPLRNPAFALRVAGETSAVAGAVRAAIRQVDPDQPVAELRTLDEHIRASLAGPRMIGLFVAALGVLAMVLAAIGIYGVMAHNVMQARREIGIRMAIGARPRRVVGMFTRYGLVLTGIGLLAGVPLAFLVQRGVVSSLNLFEVQISSAYALGGAALLAGVAGLASWLPALRAARVQPASSLQNE